MAALRELHASEIDALAAVVAKLRPHGARRWQAAGVRAAFAKVANLDAANVLMAAIRLSQDRSAETPAQIGIPSSQCWVEKVGEWQPAPEPYDLERACGICDQPEERCTSNPHAGHEYVRKVEALRERIPGEHAPAIVGDLRDRLAKAQHVDQPAPVREKPEPTKQADDPTSEYHRARKESGHGVDE